MPNNAKHPTPHAIIVMGVSGSGKSTIGDALAIRLGWAYEDGDAYHPPGNVAKMHAGHPLTDDDRWPWLRAIAEAIDQHIVTGRPIVIACSALKRAYRDILVHGRDDIRIVYLKGSRELIARRLKARKGHFMPPGLLDSQFATLEEPVADEHVMVIDIDTSVEAIVDEITRRLASPSPALPAQPPASAHR